MNNNSTIRYLTVEETAIALRDARKDGVVNSNSLDTYPIEYQNQVIKQLRENSNDDRSAYHREYMANMKAKELKQDISDDEEERIIKAYGKNKDFQKLREQAMKEKAELEKEELVKSTKAKKNWNNKNKKEAPPLITKLMLESTIEFD
jgi:hypothetical protein